MTLQEAKEGFDYAMRIYEDALRIGPASAVTERRFAMLANWASIYLAVKSIKRK